MGCQQSLHTAIASRAGSHRVCGMPTIPATAKIPVGAGLPAMAVGQSTSSAQVFRHRQQGWLPQVLWDANNPGNSANPCGSWLASDGGGSVNFFGTGIPPSPAGLAPTGFWVAHQICAWRRSMWELALQAIGPALPTFPSTDTPLSLASQLPQGLGDAKNLSNTANPCGS